ncbi:MAG: PEGA domain-containing protein [Candidatus Xenobia bacterium]
MLRERLRERLRIVLRQSRWRLAAALLAGIFLLAYHPPSGARVTVTSTPPGAAVVIDGEARGNTPTEVQLDSGAHQLVVEYQGKPVAQRQLTLSDGEQQKVDVTIH